jgi:hypothetical protein
MGKVFIGWDQIRVSKLAARETQDGFPSLLT